MHTPPDPERPPPPAPPDGPAAASNGSTGDYTRPLTPSSGTSSLVELFGSSMVRLTARPEPANTDDSPTVITPGRKEDVPRPAVAGQILGHFELIESIGSGGMATVLKARDLQLGRIVALKILPPDTAADPETVTRFKQEARAAAKLDHDNVARVYFCGEDRGLHFIAFEFVQGENLRQRIDRTGPLAPGEAVRLMQQVTAGLGHAAERGVVHRDIKPSNILLTPDGRAKIVDMGLARHLESQSVNGGVTQSGITLGTFDYISPEQAMDPRRADVRSDIYSLGCAFYHALTGRPPVPEGTAAKKLHAHQHESPVDPRDLNPRVPDALAVVLGKMMAKDPTRRHQTPAELTGELSAVAAALGLSDAAADAGGQAAVAALTREPPRLPVGLIAAAAALAVAAAVLVGTGGPAAGPTPPPWGDPPAPFKPPTDPLAAGGPTPPPAEPDRRPVVAATAEQLAAALAAGGNQTIHLLPDGNYELRSLDAGAVFAGGDLTIEPVPGDPDRRPQVWVKAGPPDGPRPGGLTVRSARKLTLRDFDLWIDAAAPGEAALADPVGLRVAAADQVVCDGMRVRATGAARAERTVGLAVEPGRPTAVSVRHSLFDMGRAGIGLAVPGRATTEVTEVGFGPHAAAVRLTAGDEPTTPGGRLLLSHATFMLDGGGAAVEMEEGAGGKVEAAGCVFAAVHPAAAPDREMMPGEEREPRPVVLRLLDPAPPTDGPAFDHPAGLPNAYFQTDAVGLGGTARPLSWDDCRALSAPPARDPSAVPLTRPPWQHEKPAAALAADRDGWKPFQLAILTDRRLQVDTADARVLGARLLRGRGDGGRIYVGDVFPVWPPPKPQPRVKAGTGERLVLADADPEDARFRVYPDLAAAFAELRPGEALVLAVSGPVPVPAGLKAKAGGLSATIRPHPDYKPVLVADGRGRARRGADALFTLTDGELRLVDLSIRLIDRQAVVRLAGGRGVEFIGCTLTLGEPDDDPAAAVVLPDPAVEMMRNPAAEPADGPRIRFERTLLRGQGRAVWVQAPRPFALTVDQTAAVLDGPFLVLDAGSKDATGPGPAATVAISRLTAVLGGPLLEVSAGRAAATVPAVTADGCLFVPLGLPAAPLLRVEDADPTAEPAAYLSWTAAGKGSVFGNWPATAAVLELRPPAADGPAVEWSFAKWQAGFARSDRRQEVRFDGGELTPDRAAGVKAADLRPTTPDNRRLPAGADVLSLPTHSRE